MSTSLEATVGIRERLSAALIDTRTTADQKARIESALSDHLSKANAQFTRTYFLFLAAATVFTLLTNAQVSELSFLGVKLTNTKYVTVINLLVANFLYYYAMSVAGYASILHETLTRFYSDEMPAFSERKVSSLLLSPSLIDIENVFATLFCRNQREERFNEAIVYSIGIPLVIAPIIWAAWASYSVFMRSGVTLFISIPVVALSIFFAIRGLSSFVKATTYP